MAASKSGSAIYQQLEHSMQEGVWGVRVQALLLGGQSLKSQTRNIHTLQPHPDPAGTFSPQPSTHHGG
jgi:hypothetical protein